MPISRLKKHILIAVVSLFVLCSYQTDLAIYAQTAPTACDADINLDKLVDISDYSLLIQDFFKTSPATPRSNINKDTIVDLSDYSILVQFFFDECPTNTITITPPQVTGTIRTKIEAETMQTNRQVISTPFNGLVFYGNGDYAQTSFSFPTLPGSYQISVRGASNINAFAGVALYIGTQKVADIAFNSSTPELVTKTVSVQGGTNPQTVKLVLESDTGQTDTFLDYIEISYQGVLPSPTPTFTPLPTPKVPTEGAVSTGQYRNLFKEIGKSDAEIQAKVNAAWESLFYGNSSTEAVYRITTTSSDMAFIEDVANSDIRSEGVSYGMMIAVQQNKRAEFDKLWKFAKTYMKCPRTNECNEGMDGYFSWNLPATAPYKTTDYGKLNPATDGEEYFATALLFASGRWGNNGTHNYRADAQAILDAMLNDNRPNSVRSMFDKQKKIVVFSPNNMSALDSDPSYHLPAFYEVWAQYDQKSDQRIFWSQAAQASRAYWKVASVMNDDGTNTGRTNGLMSDCTTLDGIPKNGCAGGNWYRFDSWRTIGNVAVDYAWWAQDPWEVTAVNNIQNFFGPKRPLYKNQWALNGVQSDGETNSTGQIAFNGLGSLASNNLYTTAFIEDVWNLPVPTGQWRYYDGMLYMMALQHMSGNFKVYPPQP